VIDKLKTFWSLLKNAFSSWNKNEPWAQSGTIAYYTLFSLPSLLIITVSSAGYFFGREAVQGRITQEITKFIGPDVAEAVQDIIANSFLTGDSTIRLIFGFGFLLFGATGVFFQLKKAMNNIWGVVPKKINFVRMLIDRAISFGMVLVLGLLMLVSLIISAMLAGFGEYLTSLLPQLSHTMVQILNFFISFFFIATLFAMIFKLLPDVRLKWKTVYLGAMLTTVLFLLGEFLIGFYFGTTDPGSVYGGASAMVLVLLWVYYSCLILFFGAEFTVQYAYHKQEKIETTKYAEPAIYQRLERLKKKKKQLLDQDRILRILSGSEENSNKK
jgi:membrane protein